jgi:acyl-CoA dehydrogenase
VDFEPSDTAVDYTEQMRAFLDEVVLPAEPIYETWRAEQRGTPMEWDTPPIVEELKCEAR